jgi:hypothetical protein
MKNKIIIFFICGIILLSTIAISANASSIKILNYNNPPDSPVIEGPLSGNIRQLYLYNVTVSDPDVDNLIIRIEINFGDGTTGCGGCDGRGPWESGDTEIMKHSWLKEGTYEITGRVLDEHGEWSDWSEPLSVTMVKTKIFFNYFFQKIFFFLPNLYKIL